MSSVIVELSDSVCSNFIPQKIISGSKMIIFDTTLLILFGLLNPVWSNKMLIRAKSRFLAKKTGGPEWSASSADAADLLDYNLKFTHEACHKSKWKIKCCHKGFLWSFCLT